MKFKAICGKISNSVFHIAKEYWYFTAVCLIFAVGIFCRVEMLMVRELWFDEMQLAINFIDTPAPKENIILWAFKPLQYYQIAPPFFLLGVKFATLIFGINEISLRLIPFISGILSIFVFYKLSKITLNTKPAVIFANLLFAINFPLVRYASEFKQYSTDVLIFMLIFIWISKINLQNPGFKTILKYSAVFTVLFFISQPSIFLLSGFILYEILYRLKSEKYANIKDLAKIISMALIPLIFVFMYKFSLPDDLSGFMDAYWTKEVPGFIAYDSILEILKENCSFFALGARYMIFFAPFVLAGFFIFLSKKSKWSLLFSCTLFSIICASILHLYPMTSRMILFLLPFAIIFIAACFDFNLKNKEIEKLFSASLIFATLFIAFLFQAKILCKNRINNILDLNGNKELMLILKDNFNTEEDVIIIPLYSKSSFKYYSYLYNFNPLNVYDEKDIQKASLKAGSCIWIYVSFNAGKTMEKLNPEISKLLNKNSKIYYEISLSRWARLLKIKLL